MLAPPSLSPALPSPTAISVAGRAGPAFTTHAMMQGFACHSRGVELLVSAAARVHARVRSKRIHDVWLRAERGRLIIACSCPARSLGLDVCKHAWAALLEVDRQVALSDLRAARGALVVEATAFEDEATPKASGPGVHATKGTSPTTAASEREEKKTTKTVANAKPARPGLKAARASNASAQPATAKASTSRRRSATPPKKKRSPSP